MSAKIKNFLIGYYQYLHILIVAGFFYALAGAIFYWVRPEQIANWPLPDMYLPMQMVLFGGNFFFFTFLSQNRRIGLWLALVILIGLFFQLQHFIFTLPLIFAWTVSGLALGAWLFDWQKLRRKN